MSSQVMQFLPSMASDRSTDVYHMSVTEFAASYHANLNNPGFTALEVMRGESIVRPIFDVDSKLAEEPSVLVKRGKLLDCQEKIASMFNSEGFDADRQIAIATRHGWVVEPSGKRVYKLSFHAFVKGFYLRLMDTRSLIINCGDVDYFDLTIYPKSPQSQQLFTVIGGRKKAGDDRVMQPQGVEPQGAFALGDFLAQNLEGCPQILEFDVTHVPQPMAVYANAPPEWDVVASVLETAGFTNPVYKGKRESSLTFSCDLLGGECLCCGLTHDSNNWWIGRNRDGTFVVKSYSDRCKKMLIGRPQCSAMIEDITPITEDTPLEQALSICLNNMGFAGMDVVRPGDCFTLQQHLQTCPTCRGQAHAAASHYMVESFINNCFTVRNEEKHCRSRIINVNTMVDEHPVLKRIIQSPKVDAPLADLYVTERGQDLTAVHPVVYCFKEGRWSVFQDADFKRDVQQFLDFVLRGLIDLLHHEEGIEQHARSPNLARIKQIKTRLLTAVDVEQSNSKRKQIADAITTLLHNSKLTGKWDSRADLLGLSNGVIMLDSCTFRPALKEDYVTLSCGYDFPSTWDAQEEAELLEFLECCYPVAEEREFVQRYSGYCLTGDHREKIFLILNDVRGGYNGKSTFLSLLMATLGDYAIKADAAVLYKQDRTRGINDHSGGLLAFEKKRLMVVEETSCGAILDEEKLKDWHGSRARVSGRQLNSKVMHEFEWITKLILAANEGKLPHFSVQDQALVERIATVPHRSRFQAPPLPDEPFTYPVNTHIKDRFPVWRPYMLNWCLAGLRRYHDIGFTNMPSGCLAFKQSIMDDKDVVKEWLQLAVEPGEDKDFVKVCDLYADFCAANRAFQGDKKTKKSAKMFERELHRCLGTKHFKDRHSVRSCGKIISIGKVLMHHAKTSRE